MIDKNIKRRIAELSGRELPSGENKKGHLTRGRPIDEIYYDWCTVRGFTDRVRSNLDWDEENGKSDTIEFKRAMGYYINMRAYLALASGERDPGQAWNHVNSADKLLPLVIDDGAFERSLLRMRGWDERLKSMDGEAAGRLETLDKRCCGLGRLDVWDPSVPEELINAFEEMQDRINLIFSTGGELELWHHDIPVDVKKILDGMFEGIREMLRKRRKVVWGPLTLKELLGIRDKAVTAIDDYFQKKKKPDPSDGILRDKVRTSIETTFRCIETIYGAKTPPQSGKAGSPAPTPTLTVSPRRRTIEYCKQANRAQLWYKVNAGLSLRYNYWTTLRNRLFLGGLLFALGVELFYLGYGPEVSFWYSPLLVWFAGLFGGLISAQVDRELVNRTTSVQLLDRLMQLRIVIGGVGALVVFILIDSGLVMDFLRDIIRDNAGAFIGMGITAGFSEQLFVSMLDNASKNLEIVGSAKKG